MWRNILKYGLIAGLVVAIPMNVMLRHDAGPCRRWRRAWCSAT